MSFFHALNSSLNQYSLQLGVYLWLPTKHLLCQLHTRNPRCLRRLPASCQFRGGSQPFLKQLHAWGCPSTIAIKHFLQSVQYNLRQFPVFNDIGFDKAESASLSRKFRSGGLPRIDDVTNTIAVHFVNGIWGLLATGFFDNKRGVFHEDGEGGGGLFGSQVVGFVVISGWGIFWGLVMFGILCVVSQHKVPAEVELVGLNYASVGWRGFFIDHNKVKITRDKY